VVLSALWLGQQGREAEALTLLSEQTLQGDGVSAEAWLVAYYLAQKIGDSARMGNFRDSIQKFWPRSIAQRLFAISAAVEISPLFALLGLGTLVAIQ
jgi:hypothetical protein